MLNFAPAEIRLFVENSGYAFMSESIIHRWFFDFSGKVRISLIIFWSDPILTFW